MKKNLLSALLLACATSTLSATVIKSIQVRGNVRLDDSIIYSYLLTKVGDDAPSFNRDIKSLYGTGFFEDVKISEKDGVMIVQIVENPIINKVAFEGMKALPKEIVEKEIRLSPRSTFKKTDLAKALDVLLQMYRGQGYFNVKISPKTIQREENRLDIVFEIDEGSPTKISKINFLGNSIFKDFELKYVIDSEETKLFSFFQTTNIYDPNRVSVDIEKLKRFYLSKGYYDFKVMGSYAELDPQYSNFQLTFKLSEGDLYNFGNISVSQNFENVNSEDIANSLEVLKGNAYSQLDVEKSEEQIMDYMAARKYPLVEVSHQVDKDENGKIINLTFNVEPGKKQIIERIDIEGNNLTKESVIRECMLLKEGDPFNPLLLRRSVKKLRALGIFEPFIGTERKKGSGPGSTVLLLRVNERSFFNIMGSASWGHTQGFGLDGNIAHKNLFGTGIRGAISTKWSQKFKEGDLSFYAPNVKGSDVGLGLKTTFSSSSDQEFRNFKENSFEISPSATMSLSEITSLSVNYSFKNTETSYFDQEKDEKLHSMSWGNRKWNLNTSSIGADLHFDWRDDPFSPTSGIYIKQGLNFTGLGGDLRFLKWGGGADTYIPLGKSKIILSVKGSHGAIISLKDKQHIPIHERYNLGYLSFRGFDVAGIGPRELKNGNSINAEANKKDPEGQGALGGLYFYKISTEISIPFGLEVPIRGMLFSDIGSVWNLGAPLLTTKDKQGNEKNSSNEDATNNIGVTSVTHELRVSVGVGIQADVPGLGRMSCGVAVPLKKGAHDKEKFFFFSFGQSL